VQWHDTTIKSKVALGREQNIVNNSCLDISKKRVEKIFGGVFGYNLSVNPLTHKGLCVVKSDANFTHDGVVVKCPISRIDRKMVYEKLVDNRIDDGHILDYRVPIIGNKIPLIYLRYRPLKERFADGNHNTRVEVAKAEDYFSPKEIAEILQFASKFKLDYGELDILRDGASGKIYIVDANSTPSGPSIKLSGRARHKAIKVLALEFQKQFLSE
jgi:hypothetical protein